MLNLDFVRGLVARTALVVALGASAAPALAQAPSFVGVGGYTYATDVSDDGTTVVGYGSDSASRGFVWTRAGGRRTLPSDGGAQIYGISGDGSVLAGSYIPTSGPVRAFRSPQSGPIELLPVPAGTGTSAAVSMSHDGSVIAGHIYDGTNYQPVRWTAGVYEQIGHLPGTNRGLSSAVSGDGSVIAGWCAAGAGPETAFRWTSAAGMQSIGETWAMTRAYGMNDDGSVIVGEGQLTVSGPLQANRWTASTGWAGLGALPGALYSLAEGTNLDGSVIIGVSQAPGVPESGFVWTPALGMVTLRDYLTMNGVSGFENWSLTAPEAMTPDGRTIVGYGVNPVGITEGFVAVVPGPGGLAAAALAACFALRRRRGRIT